jgi:hypothetical protein
MATNTHATVEELLDASFYMQSMLYQRKVDDQFYPELLVHILLQNSPHSSQHKCREEKFCIMFMEQKFIAHLSWRTLTSFALQTLCNICIFRNADQNKLLSASTNLKVKITIMYIQSLLLVNLKYIKNEES